jgi:GxxExxY protein
MQDKVIYKELSYEVVGVLFDVFVDVGYGYSEKYYQRAIAKGFKKQNIHFKEQVPYTLKFKGEQIGKFYFDFLIEKKIILEIKVGEFYGRKNIQQLRNYLKVSGLELGILANFTLSGVKFIRILNMANYKKEPEIITGSYKKLLY